MDAALEAQAANEASLEAAAALPELGAPPSEIKPSISAAQLFNDSTNTVSYAQSTVVTEAPVAAPAALPATPSTASGDSATPVQPVATPINVETSTPDPAPVAVPVAVPVETPAAEPTETTAQPDPAPGEPTLNAAQPDPAPIATSFVGSNTPTFRGELNADASVQLTWDVDPTARGYNVYRDAEYIATVFENKYLDNFDAFDRDYYYEIQAFDPNENYSTIATGLTVTVTGTGRTDPNAPVADADLLKNYELRIATLCRYRK